MSVVLGVGISVLPSQARLARAESVTGIKRASDSKSVDGQAAVIGPVLSPLGGSEKEPVRRLSPVDPLAPRARELELALKEAAQDFGLALDLTGTIADHGIKESALIARASSGVWVISPRLEGTPAELTLRIVIVPPHGTTLFVRVEKTDAAHLSARAVVMLRDLLAASSGSAKSFSAMPAEDLPPPEDEAGRSRGRPVLAVSSALLGLYSGLAIHRSAGNDDPRILYPLLALGSGVGLGAALLAAEEWNITTATAFTLAGGSLWGVTAGLSLASAYVQKKDDRLFYGLIGGLTGTTLAAGALGFTRFDDGDAALVHSGAALGTMTGAMIEGLVSGSLSGAVSKGLGYGGAVGLACGGLIAVVARTSASRVMLIDLGAGLGALGAASIASPLLFKDDSPTRARLFVASALAGTLVGGTLAFLLTRDSPTPAAKAADGGKPRFLPGAGILPVTPLGATFRPVFGATLSGAF